MSADYIKDPPLTNEEISSIESCFQPSQLPLLIFFRSDIRYDKISRPNSALALSMHFIGVFAHEKIGEQFKLIKMIHISEIDTIYYSTQPFVLVQTKTSKLIATSNKSLRFAQLLYVICAISFSYYPDNKKTQIQSDNQDLFPEIDFNLPRNQFPIPLSFSQQFQFSYYADCSLNNIIYNHEVVRYINSMMLSANSIIDITQLPLDLTKEENKNDLIPIFNSLCYLNFTNGICCRNLCRSDILNSLVQLISSGNAVKIIHIENCNASSGLKEIASAIKFNPDLEISYWNLSNNPLSNFNFFCDIIKYSKNELLYLNLNNCGIVSPNSEDLFSALWRNSLMHNIRHLYISGIEFKSIDSFEKYLSRNLNIETLDLSNINNMLAEILHILSVKNYNLSSLILNGSNISDDSLKYLLTLIRNSTALKFLDISGTGITNQSSQPLIDIITTISLNDNIQLFSLNLNNLNLHDEYILILYRAFLNNNLLKWKRLSFDENCMNSNDIRHLVPLLCRMSNLESVSFSGNFNDQMLNVGLYCSEILNIPNLKELIIRGHAQFKLKHELIPLLQKVIQMDKIKSLDISGNKAGNAVLNYISQIIFSCKKLEKFNVDDNEFSSIDKIETIVNAMHKNKYIVSMPFPIIDAQNIISQFLISSTQKPSKNEQDKHKTKHGGKNKNKKKNRNKKELAETHENKDCSINEINPNNIQNINFIEMVRALSELQMRAVNAVNANRTSKKMPNDLPFPATDEIIELINQISHKTRERIRKIIPKRHSGISNFFRLPLPFQNKGELPFDGGFVEKIDIGQLRVYDIESMDNLIVENKKTYQTCICPTMFLSTRVNDDVFKSLDIALDQRNNQIYESKNAKHKITIESSSTEKNYSSSEENKYKKKDDQINKNKHFSQNQFPSDSEHKKKIMKNNPNKYDDDVKRRRKDHIDNKRKYKKGDYSSNFSNESYSEENIENKKPKVLPPPQNASIFKTRIPIRKNSSSDSQEDIVSKRRSPKNPKQSLYNKKLKNDYDVSYYSDSSEENTKIYNKRKYQVETQKNKPYNKEQKNRKNTSYKPTSKNHYESRSSDEYSTDEKDKRFLKEKSKPAKNVRFDLNSANYFKRYFD